MLYVVGTPIGNLQDLSLRQAAILASAEILLTEDTRSTGMLLESIQKLFSFKRNPVQRLISYYQEREFDKLPQILELIESGKDIALLSEAGMPLISDPGGLLVQELVKRKIPFTVIPGPTAATTALLYSGMNFRHFTFYGFLPKKQNEITKVFLKLKEMSFKLDRNPVIFYESAARIQNTLSVLNSIDHKASISVSRELTKKFEETVRGTSSELLQKKFKGELVLIVLFS